MTRASATTQPLPCGPAEDTRPIALMIVDDSSVELPNVKPLVFAEEQGSYLVGVAAGHRSGQRVVPAAQHPEHLPQLDVHQERVEEVGAVEERVVLQPTELAAVHWCTAEEAQARVAPYVHRLLLSLRDARLAGASTVFLEDGVVRPPS